MWKMLQDVRLVFIGLSIKEKKKKEKKGIRNIMVGKFWTKEKN